jgi:glycosyltransferase involved in cell wall biosynthesis
LPENVKVSVVIPAYNEEKLLGETLTAVKAASAAFHQLGWVTETIVCDNNSNDRTAEIARASDALVVFEPVNQISRARNTGARHATGDWLVFIDADSQPTSHLFADVARAISSGRYLAGGSTIAMRSGNFYADRLVSLWNCLSRWRRLMAGSFIFCEAAAFRQVNGFSQALYVSEEIDLSVRLRKFARRTRQTIVILSDHPLTTSPRKLHLYRRREYARFMLGVFCSFGRAMRHREACSPWYDGRR